MRRTHKIKRDDYFHCLHQTVFKISNNANANSVFLNPESADSFESA